MAEEKPQPEQQQDEEDKGYAEDLAEAAEAAEVGGKTVIHSTYRGG